MKIQSISIAFSGLSLKFMEFNACKIKRIIILIAGPITNLLIAIIVYFFYQEKYLFFVVCNISLSIFNILPIYPLDGGRILLEILNHEKILDMIQKTFCLILIIICIYMYINYQTVQIVFLGIYLLGFANTQKYDKYFLNID